MDENEEDQENEMEALEAIFEDAFDLLQPVPPRGFRLKIVPNPGGTTEENQVSVLLDCVLPLTYPKVPPNIILSIGHGLPKRHMAKLESIISETIEEMEGDVMIFTMAEAVKDFLVDHNQPEASLHDSMLARQQQEEPEELVVEEVDKQVIGGDSDSPAYTNPLGIDPATLVTMETFLEWKKKFDAEKLATQGAGVVETAPVGMTGKGMFLANLAKLTEEDVPAEVTKGEEVFWFNEEIYNDEDLPDTDEDEDGGSSKASDQTTQTATQAQTQTQTQAQTQTQTQSTAAVPEPQSSTAQTQTQAQHKQKGKKGSKKASKKGSRKGSRKKQGKPQGKPQGDQQRNHEEDSQATEGSKQNKTTASKADAGDTTKGAVVDAKKKKRRRKKPAKKPVT